MRRWQKTSFPPREALSGNPITREARAAGFPLMRFALAGMTDAWAESGR